MRPNPEVPHFRPLLWVFFQADFAALVAPALLPWLAQKHPLPLRAACGWDHQEEGGFTFPM